MGKPITAGGPAREWDIGAYCGKLVMDGTHGQIVGYLQSVQTPDGTFHLISNRLHYRFNLAWLKAPPRHESRSPHTGVVCLTRAARGMVPRADNPLKEDTMSSGSEVPAYPVTLEVD